jgi:hypothetical protein
VLPSRVGFWPCPQTLDQAKGKFKTYYKHSGDSLG